MRNSCNKLQNIKKYLYITYFLKYFVLTGCLKKEGLFLKLSNLKSVNARKALFIRKATNF